MKTVHVPPPSPRDLLPPLLACLSTASTSPQPPPALLPLLSPILRQRLQLLSSDSWLSLLSWDRDVASRLQQAVSNIHVEPHPVSGEIEVEEPHVILYRRSDPETLHARFVLPEFGIVPTYLWCTGGEGGDTWRLSELRGMDNTEDGTQWFHTVAEANEKGLCRTSTTSSTAHLTPAPAQRTPQHQEEDDDDDSYWAAYDRTPGRTPQQKRSPAPVTNSRVQLPSQSELEYFARYAAEVQPALDAHDPDEETPAAAESTLNGNTLNLQQERETQQLEQFPSPDLPGVPNETISPNGFSGVRRDSLRDLHEKPEHIENIDGLEYAALNHPRPSSAASSSSVEKLEREAERNSQAELAIKQHISTDMKSLFRLARTAGIDREEFERIIRRELEVLPMLDRDE